jgi:hypothetical protein
MSIAIEPVSTPAAQLFWGGIMNAILRKIALIWTVPVLLLVALVTSLA